MNDFTEFDIGLLQVVEKEVHKQCIIDLVRYGGYRQAERATGKCNTNYMRMYRTILKLAESKGYEKGKKFVDKSEIQFKVLLLDIETAPTLAHVWNLWKQNVGLNQIIEAGYTLCWCAKWYGQDDIYFDSIHHSEPKRMIENIRKMLHDADAVVHYNGSKFDIPILNKDIIKYNLPIPSPYKQIDLLKTVKERFRFTSNKLDFVSQQLNLGSKVEHEGHNLWVKCMNGDAKAWQDMQSYNEHDVILLERLYERLKGWIKQHPNVGVHKNVLACPNCGSDDYTRKGSYVVGATRFAKYGCNSCGHWFRASHSNMLGEPKRFISINS